MPNKLQHLVRHQILQKFQTPQNFRTNLNKLLHVTTGTDQEVLEALSIYYNIVMVTRIDYYHDTLQYKSLILEAKQYLHRLRQDYNCDISASHHCQTVTVLIEVIDFSLDYVKGVRPFYNQQIVNRF